MKEPLPIVVQAEAEDSLPGLGLFIQALKPAVVNARHRRAEAHVAGWNVARAIFEYSARADVQARIKQLNYAPNGKMNPGRPKTAHGLVMDAAAERGMSRKTLEKWVYEWFSPGDKDTEPSGVSVLLKLKPGCGEKQFAENVVAKAKPEYVEELLAKLAEAKGDQTPQNAADKIKNSALKIAEYLEVHADRRALDLVIKTLEPALERFGYAVQKLPKQPAKDR
ncbi:MAG: hypothetical protein HS116_02315 [Planctomycetes bacterium]|nr:hypothetical protein [Planctomycetota bacterium]